MSRKAAIIVLASIAITVGLAIGINKIPFFNIEPDSMPGGLLQYTDPENVEQVEDLLLSGYHWEVDDPFSSQQTWVTVGPNNFFTQRNEVSEILPGELAVKLQLVWVEPPDNIIIKRWPLSEWISAGFDENHSEGVDVPRSWLTLLQKTDIGFDVERESLYGVWIYYGDDWVEYSFIVPGEDPTSYDYLGYFSGFENPNADSYSLDPVEWVDVEDIERIDELKLNPDKDMPSGFYINNPSKEVVPLRLTDQTKYTIIDPELGYSPKTVDRSEFLNYLNQSLNFGETTLFWIAETDGNVEFIKEQYLPGYN